MTRITGYTYNLYGFLVASDFELPELGPSKAVGSTSLADHSVEIRRGRVPASLEDGRKVEDFFEFNGAECIYIVKDVARYLISRGRDIVIEPHTEASMIDIRYYLFGTIIGALLHQRQVLPLHVSAVETPEGIMAFTGPSGAGKSTLAYEIHKTMGWRLLTDDVAVIDPSIDHTLLHCGIFRQKLWKDTIERAGLATEHLTRDTTRAEKFHVTSPNIFVAEPRPLHRLVALEVGPEPKLERLGPSQAFAQIMNTIYRPDLAGVYANREALMDTAAKIAGDIETFRFVRPWSVEDMSLSIRYLLGCFDVA